MPAISTIKISDAEVERLLNLEENHFCDLKAMEVAPAKLTRSIAAFSNAEGGELFVGVDEKPDGTRQWRGFETPEQANGHIQAFEEFFPLSSEYLYDLLSNENHEGLVLKLQVAKTREIKKASDQKVYVRRGAQNLPIDSEERMEVLRRQKGITSFENETVPCGLSFVTNSEEIIAFMLEVVPTAEPEPWLRKQMMIVEDKPTVAATVLFADEPQAILPKRCGLKLYRYKTTAEEGTRESLDFDPETIEGPAYRQIRRAVERTQDVIQSVQIRTSTGLKRVNYPPTAIHEIITNAVLHRDYALTDDIHIKIFDNRVEVLSPGSLPGHITADNILDERLPRNSALTRLINKFPDPPNKDVGEGLNTAFQAMRDMKLKDPIIAQRGGYVAVELRHESLASPEEAILEYLQANREIANREARAICYIGSENKMKTILQRMVRDGLIELVPGRSRYNAAYRIPGSDEEE